MSSIDSGVSVDRLGKTSRIASLSEREQMPVNHHGGRDGSARRRVSDAEVFRLKVVALVSSLDDGAGAQLERVRSAR